MHRITSKFLNFFKRKVRPSLCADCKEKMDRKFGLAHRIKHRIKHRKSHSKRSHHKMSKKEARARFRKLLPRINAGRRKKGLKPIHLKRG